MGSSKREEPFSVYWIGDSKTQQGNIEQIVSLLEKHGYTKLLISQVKLVLHYIPGRANFYCCDDYVLILVDDYAVPLSIALSDGWIVVEQDFTSYQTKELFKDVNELIQKIIWLNSLAEVLIQTIGGN